MRQVTGIILSGVLAIVATGCDYARTSADAPDTLTDETEDPAQVQETLEDAESEIRQDQLSSDIRAREQRNEVFGEEGVRADSDIESEVRAKLEANIPRSKLTVQAKNGNVTIVGTVPDEREAETIKPLAHEIEGVDSVQVDVNIVSPVGS
ncbi:MAG: BON domain-containing protein [Limnospira sp.]